MLSAVSGYTESRGIALNARSAAMTGKSFGDILSDKLSGENVAAVPTNWLNSGRTTNVFDAVFGAVADYLSEAEGVDISARTPTHEITDEQAEWLRSRNDLDSFPSSGGLVYGQGSDDYYNFLGDLVYLNVISPDEAKTMNGVAVPAHPTLVYHGGFYETEDNGYLEASDDEADSFIEMIKRAIDKQRELIELFKRKADDPKQFQPEDLEYIRSASAFLENKQEIFTALQKLFDKELYDMEVQA